MGELAINLVDLAKVAGLRHQVNAAGEFTRVECNSDNVYRIMRSHPWFRQNVWFNCFTGVLQFGGVPLEDSNVSHILGLLQHDINPKFRSIHVSEALSRLSLDPDFSRNPLVEYLDILEWDGVSRVETFFENHCNAMMPHQYLAAAGRNWFIMLAARAYTPGCKADNMLILEGAQGIGKSRALEAIGGEYYRDIKVWDIGSKDFLQTVHGAWIYDINELRGMSRSSHETIKALLSSTQDTFRLPYGRLPVTLKRSCVIVGTTNKFSYLTDETGNRRFWPVRCGYTVEVDLIKRDREQLLAEAVALFKAGEDWWRMPDALQAEIAGARESLSSYIVAVREATSDFDSMPKLVQQNFQKDKADLIFYYTTIERIAGTMGIKELTMPQLKDISKALRSSGFEQNRVEIRNTTEGNFTSEGRITVYRKYAGPRDLVPFIQQPPPEEPRDNNVRHFHKAAT